MDEVVALHERIQSLETALADYAFRFGLTEAARENLIGSHRRSNTEGAEAKLPSKVVTG